MKKLSELSKSYNELHEQMHAIGFDASYYESVLLKYDGVECYIDELSLFNGFVVLRVNQADIDRFKSGHQTIKITMEEFDSEVTILE